MSSESRAPKACPDSGCRSFLLASFAAIAALLAPPTPLHAQDPDNFRASVARVSWLSGEVGYSRGDDPDRWDAASPNFPMVSGDRLYTGRGGKAELEVSGVNIFLASRTDLAALDLSSGWTQLSLTGGAAIFRVFDLGEGGGFEVATPAGAVSFDGPGMYRVDVDSEGLLRVTVGKGTAFVEGDGGRATVRAGESLGAEGGDRPFMRVGNARPADAFDLWVAERVRRLRRVRSLQWVDPAVEGAADLDEWGRWQEVPDYGWAWTPSAVVAGWAPYRDGRWVWQDPWGWAWVSSEPWGWTPYHYGRWTFYSSRWWWVPGSGSERPRWSPALVAFVGGGPGGLPSVAAGGYVGWFPLAPRDPFDPWWRPGWRPHGSPGAVFGNRTFVTVVPRTTFVSGSLVRGHVVRDNDLVLKLGRGDVIRGPIPVPPERTSIAVSPSRGASPAPRPPSSWASRPVVTKTTPPPRPSLFSDKIPVIRGQGGAPVQSPVRPQATGPAVVHSPRPPRESGYVSPAPPERPRAVESPRNAASARPTAPPSYRAVPPATPPSVRPDNPDRRIEPKPAPRVMSRPEPREAPRPQPGLEPRQEPLAVPRQQSRAAEVPRPAPPPRGELRRSEERTERRAVEPKAVERRPEAKKPEAKPEAREKSPRPRPTPPA